jgi:acyl-homoserine lactone acylase PvdQ
VTGINQYIAEARLNPTKMPGEYVAIGQPTGPTDWKVTDVISTASLVAGIFGKGGGGEVDSALVLEDARQRFGNRKGKRVWKDFRSANDREAPTTVKKTKFPYEKVPRKVRGRALPDPGTTEEQEEIVAASGSGGSATAGRSLLQSLLAIPEGNSNALLVSARESESGSPLAVMGPQTGYFAPQILMEQDIHAPASADGPPIDARGVAFPGTNLYVQIGRGRDHAWSATSAGQDIIDTFAMPLCEPGGSAPTLDSDHYLFRGQCLPFEVLERTNTWSPTPADDTPAGSETLRALRTKLGIVTHRAMIDGVPHVYTRLRITYFHEVDSALGFADYNNPQKVHSPQTFQQAACRIDFTFNWFYVDGEHIGYFNSGKNPVRAKRTDPNFPVHASREWSGFDPDRYGPNGHNEAVLGCDRHPQVVDQRYLTSWNNKQARGYRAADDNWAFQSLHRSQPLDNRIKRGIKGGNEMSLVELIDAMEDAGTVDLRGDKALKWALKVIKQRKVKDAELRAAVATLNAWRKSGAHRRDLDQDGVYDHAEAVRIMDAWWPLLVEAQFKPTLGKELFDRIVGMVDLDDEPNADGQHLGSAYIAGWYGYVQKDLRAVLGKHVRGDYSKQYCGGGRLKRCRKALLGSLGQALQADPATLYEDPVAAEECDGGDAQWCFDAVRHRPLGGITQPFIHWINRPTFQQAVEIP